MPQSKTQFESLLGWRYIAFYHEGCVGVGCNNHPGAGCNSVKGGKTHMSCSLYLNFMNNTWF